jgi:hypothetical protein
MTAITELLPITAALPLAGILIDETLATKIFYGLRVERESSNLFIDEIFDGNGIIVLPNAYQVDPNDYRQWLWSKTKLNFELAANGHLLLTIN